jgi:hypothetical protein
VSVAQKKNGQFYVPRQVLLDAGVARKPNRSYAISHALDTETNQWVAIENACRIGIFDAARREHIDSVTGASTRLAQAIRRARIKLAESDLATSSTRIITPRHSQQTTNTTTTPESLQNTMLDETIKSMNDDDDEEEEEEEPPNQIEDHSASLTYENFKSSLEMRIDKNAKSVLTADNSRQVIYFKSNFFFLEMSCLLLSSTFFLRINRKSRATRLTRRPRSSTRPRSSPPTSRP